MLRKYWLAWITIVLAAAQLARCYSTLTIDYLNLADYANGRAPMPYQGRMLMMPLLRWAQSNPGLLHFCVGRTGSFRDPAHLVITIVALTCLLLTSWLCTLWYLRAGKSPTMPWLPAALLLVICAVQYVLHSQNVLYPYDMLSMAFFTLGCYLIYIRQVWYLVLLFPVMTLNREVAMFLIPLLLLDGYAADGFACLKRPMLLAQVALMSITWLALHKYVGHLFAANPTEMGSRLMLNVFLILNPDSWPQLASIGGFLLPFVWIYRKRMEPRLRSYLWILLPWTAMMFVYAMIVESRVYGELGGLFAVTSAFVFAQPPHSPE